MADPSPEIAAQLQQLESSYGDNPGRYFVPYAGLLREAGQPERAEEVLRENLKRFPGLSAHVLLGRCLADRGAHQEASNEFHYVLSIDAQNLIALRSLAEIAAAAGRVDEARRWYGELLAVDPMNADARAAVARLGQGTADAATADQPAGEVGGWPGAAETQEEGEPAAEAEWGNLELDDALAPPAASGGEAFDALGFGGVELPEPDDGARQDPGGAADLPLLDFAPEADAEEEPVPAALPEEPEVVTETMAELYASQGLTARAAEVYRELILRRGEEPNLVRRLAELEGRPAEPVPAPAAETAGEEDGFAASVSAAFAGDAPAEAAPAGEEGEGFDLLVIDEAAPLDGDAHPPASPEEAAELSADWAVAAAPLEEQEEELRREAEGERRTMRGYFAALLAWSAGGEAADALAAEPEPQPEPTPAEEPEPEPEEPLPWELPAPEDASPAEQEPAAGAGGGGFSFEDFFGSGAAPAAEAEPEPEPEPAPPPAAAEPAPPAPGGTEAAAGAAAGEEDEDLESFQAWLQSLKR